ncbi:mediator of RNA polymerase II transcription complex subunit 8-domain-containing protein [Xylariomycetidae sp. FL0641]|nr:mediator of RNA polymerase II transcription complex subunit 8-domain-containing protein [Xylariomycetidae sp. FL0641]KAI0020099.1 mediator of RNA polymerase II transcription complex subunit 8-domain-containing protein [Xylariomycetidae sp. FL0641]
MASLNLSQEELKGVEQARQRLFQLTNSIVSLKNDVFTTNPLPDLESLQASADILQLNLRAVLDVISQHQDLFSRVAVHPSTNFPGRTQPHILYQLLRKRPEPGFEAAIAEGRKTLAELPRPDGNAPSAENEEEQNHEKEHELENMWASARELCMNRIVQYAMNEEGDPFTEEEHEQGIENVRTGLRRVLWDEDEDEDEEGQDESGAQPNAHADMGDDDVMEIDRPLPPPAPAVSTQEIEGTSLENILRYATRGQIAP